MRLITHTPRWRRERTSASCRSTSVQLPAPSRASVERLPGLRERNTALSSGSSCSRSVSARTEIDGWIRSRKLIRAQRGTNVLGPIGGPLALEMAAVLTCGNAAWISDESAAYLFALRRERPDSTHLTSSSLMRRPGIRVHRRALRHRRGDRNRPDPGHHGHRHGPRPRRNALARRS